MTSSNIYFLLIARNIDLLPNVLSETNAENFVVIYYIFYINEMV
jgi:hypothetical protein